MALAIEPAKHARLKPGAVVVAISGHDRGRLYLVLAREHDRLSLSDGKYRPLAKQKQKNVRHVAFIQEWTGEQSPAETLSACGIEREQDSFIRKYLRAVERAMAEEDICRKKKPSK